MQFSQKPNKSNTIKEKNPFEGLDLGSLTDDSQAPFSLDSDSFDTNNFENFPGLSPFEKSNVKEPKRARKIEMIFNYKEYAEERQIVSELKELLKAVKKEVKTLEKKTTSLSKEVVALTLKEQSTKPKIYDIRFLELVVRLLRNLIKTVTEGKMCLEISSERIKAKKFRGLAKKKGTSFSMSRELTQANTPG